MRGGDDPGGAAMRGGGDPGGAAMRGGDDPGGEALRLRARILLAQLREVQALLQPGELLESGPERLVMAAKLGADPVRLEIDMTNFMARGEPFIQTSGRNVGAVMHSRSYAQEASNAGEAELSLVEFVRAFREFFTVEVQRRTERQSEPPGVLLTLQSEMDVACHFLFGDASKLLGTPPGALPLRRSREADPPPGGDGRASGRIPLRLLGKDGARGTMDLRLDAGVSAQAGDDLGADVRFTVTTGYPRSPVRVEALEAWGGGGAAQVHTCSGGPGAGRRPHTGGDRRGAEARRCADSRALYPNLAPQSKMQPLQMPPAAAGGGGGGSGHSPGPSGGQRLGPAARAWDHPGPLRGLLSRGMSPGHISESVQGGG